ncbi:hypothetical protein GCM10027040_30550 [Halomonas shantousis]
MNTTPPDKSSDETTNDVPLNPALKKRHDELYGPDQRGTDPMKTVSVQKDEGKAWPTIWAVVAIVCVLVTIMLLIF